MGDMRETEIQKGSETSKLAAAYRIYSSDLVRFAGVLVGPDHAADIVSSAVIRLLDSGYESVRNDRPYLFQAVANQARNWKRGEARRRVREERSSAMWDPVYLAEPYPEIRRAVEGLSVRQRAVVYLGVLGGLKRSDDRRSSRHQRGIRASPPREGPKDFERSAQ